MIERALVVHLPNAVQEERFQVIADEWRASLTKDFPHLETLTEWTLHVVEKNGMPMLDTAGQTMTLRQTFWQLGAAQRKKQGMQLWQDKISFNILGAVGESRDFEELAALADHWLPRWKQDFQIPAVSGITLQYVNLLSKETLPTFFDGQQLKIGEAVRLFGGLPVQRNLLVPPFDFQVNVRVDDVDPPARVAAHCTTVQAPENEGPTMHLRFTATTNLGNPPRSVGLESVDREINLAHKLILEAFDAYFTDTAKASFEPICL